MFALRRTAAMMTSVHRQPHLSQAVFRANFAISAAVGPPCILALCRSKSLCLLNFGIGWVDEQEKKIF